MQTKDLIDAARDEIQQEILQKAARPLSPHTNYWRFLCDTAFGIEALPLPKPPCDWDCRARGRFEGRLQGDPLDPEASCHIEYLHPGTPARRIARILHELAEYLLLLRLPTLLENQEAPDTLKTAPIDAEDLRHIAARQIEIEILDQIFPAPKVQISKSPIWKQAALKWHAAHPSIPEPERIPINEIDP